MEDKKLDMLIITYGEIVKQVIKDCNQDVGQVNAQLETL
jgi:hypothetical protein